MTRLSAGKRLAQMRAYVGREAMILLEDPREGGFPGYTENYIRVRVEDPGFDIRNRRARVRLDSIQGDWMSGTLLELLDG